MGFDNCSKMVLAAPFTTEYYYEIIEGASERMGKKHFLVNADGDRRRGSRFFREDRYSLDRLVYYAFSEFMAKFEAVLPVGHVNHWFSEEDFNTWIHTLIYLLLSFIRLNQVIYFGNILNKYCIWHICIAIIVNYIICVFT